MSEPNVGVTLPPIEVVDMKPSSFMVKIKRGQETLVVTAQTADNRPAVMSAHMVENCQEGQRVFVGYNELSWQDENSNPVGFENLKPDDGYEIIVTGYSAKGDSRTAPHSFTWTVPPKNGAVAEHHEPLLPNPTLPAATSAPAKAPEPKRERIVITLPSKPTEPPIHAPETAQVKPTGTVKSEAEAPGTPKDRVDPEEEVDRHPSRLLGQLRLLKKYLESNKKLGLDKIQEALEGVSRRMGDGPEYAEVRELGMECIDLFQSRKAQAERPASKPTPTIKPEPAAKAPTPAQPATKDVAWEERERLRLKSVEHDTRFDRVEVEIAGLKEGQKANSNGLRALEGEVGSLKTTVTTGFTNSEKALTEGLRAVQGAIDGLRQATPPPPRSPETGTRTEAEPSSPKPPKGELGWLNGLLIGAGVVALLAALLFFSGIAAHLLGWILGNKGSGPVAGLAMPYYQQPTAVPATTTPPSPAPDPATTGLRETPAQVIPRPNARNISPEEMRGLSSAQPQPSGGGIENEVSVHNDNRVVITNVIVMPPPPPSAPAPTSAEAGNTIVPQQWVSTGETPHYSPTLMTGSPGKVDQSGQMPGVYYRAGSQHPYGHRPY